MGVNLVLSDDAVPDPLGLFPSCPNGLEVLPRAVSHPELIGRARVTPSTCSLLPC